MSYGINKKGIEKLIAESGGGHTQNTDQYLDLGGVNQRAAAELPKQLIANTIYYINPDTGSNSNPGTALLPFQTIQYAISLLPKNLGNKAVNIRLQPSLNYTASVSISNFYNIGQFILRGEGTVDDVLIKNTISISNCFGKINIFGLSIKLNANNRTCITAFQSYLVEVSACKFSSGGYSSSTGVKSDGSSVRLSTTGYNWDFDSDKVAIGVKSLNGGIVKFVDPAYPTFGTALYDNQNDGLIILGTGKNIVDANFDLAIARQHLQGTDQGLDTGGANASTAADVKDAVTKKHTQNTDTSIGTPSALVLDQNYPGTENSADPLDGGYVIAQPFVAGLSGELQKITLKLYKVGVPSGDFTVELRNTELDGTPGTNVLATKTKTAAEIPDTSAIVDFIFSVPYSVVATTRYAIVTYGAGMSAGNYYVIVDENPGTFDIGFYYATGSQPWTWAIQNTTMYFKTYIYQIGITVTSISASSNFDIAGEMSVKVYSQASEPILGANNRIAIWIDTDDSNRVYILFKRGTGDQVAVELA